MKREKPKDGLAPGNQSKIGREKLFKEEKCHGLD
jgi:hypothetical protein